MFDVDADGTIRLTRGDVAELEVSAKLPDGEDYVFGEGDVVRLRVLAKGNVASVALHKDVAPASQALSVTIPLESAETKLGGLASKPVEYWYEVELNPDTAPQTIVGYGPRGPKRLIVYPEGGDRR